MRPNRRSALNRQHLRFAFAALFVLLLAACSDGYPTEDVPQIDPARMTQAQLLAALNALGKEPQLGKRWRYAMHANCELDVSMRNGERDRRRVVLKGAEVTTRLVEGVSEIRLIPRLGGEAKGITVLETRRWSDTVRARSLFTNLEFQCSSQVPRAA